MSTMRIEEADIAVIHGLLKDYQQHTEHIYGHFSFPYTIMSPKDALNRREVRERIANTAPLITKVLSMGLPPGFTLLKTIDEQCYAWNAHVTLGMYGPVTEFQARLWCWQNECVNEEIKINIIEDEEEEKIEESFKEVVRGL